jgi:hypothetical protein
MPRKGPGGVRQGTPGTPYPNRSDLRAPGNETVKGQPYGQRAQQQAAQQAIPLTPPPTAVAPSAGPAPPTPGALGAPPQPTGGVPAGGPPAGMAPGELKWLHPSDRPNEPVTAGLPSGPGPGPEALGGIGAVAANMASTDSTAALITSLASRPTAGAVLRSLASAAAAGPVR